MTAEGIPFTGDSNPFFNEMSLEEQDVANRIAQLGRMFAAGKAIQFKITTFREGQKPVESKFTVENFLKDSEQAFLTILRSDFTSGPGAELLRKVKPRSRGKSRRDDDDGGRPDLSGIGGV